ncbi:sodium:alanine symporter family protein [Ponticaulis sp.]|uniref:alanine/glycine:cation symporter family protein n=1 Tax=Ponticaulis sp. TaxID=2020902 RepID=UPI000B6F32D1|nr:amino acid carrier protein [Ponticaulis sp.]MAI91203.1 alanine glycine permease [Ponticaulis sp.]OUX98517.1 MAG: alanine glycine permease [Hyphomonadaceae bacterium TMED5]|tara:strand:+ start:86877 stop:88280 length:1404 start_codon:yes stop_codon:yes gene_type:complete
MTSALDALETFSGHLVSFVFTAVPIAGTEVNLIVIWLAAAMIFFTIFLRFPSIRCFGLAINTVRGKHEDKDAPGEMTQFAALTTALSGTIGLGNIAGVAIAVAIGGPGALFWMVIIGLFAMSLKFAEVLLAVKYRTVLPNGRYSGGPMWTLKNGLAAKGMPRLGKILGGIYACFAILAFIQTIQVNQSYSQVQSVLGLSEGLGPAMAYGIGISVLAALVLLGGAHSIAKVTARLTPLMCLAYLIGVFSILALNVTEIPHAVSLIVSQAFQPDSVAGGAIGAFIAGMRRAAFSNEAGIGSATIAHAAAKTRHPASEGMVALLEPFIDTVLICSATGIALIVSGAWETGLTDVAMTSAAFATVSSWFPYLLAVAVCLFAFSTVLAVGYYGLQVSAYLFGSTPLKNRLYLIWFCGTLPLGALVDTTTVINLTDSLFFLLSVPNLIGLYILSGDVRRDTKEYLALVKKGEA